MAKKYQHIWLTLIVLFAFYWRVRALDYQSLWRDEVDAIYFATQPLPDLLRMVSTPSHNGPFYYLTLRPWFELVGITDFSARYLSALAGTISTALIWPVTRLMVGHLPADTGQKTALGAAALMAINPYQLWYSQEAKMYALIVALTLLSTWCFLLALQRGKNRYFVFYVIVTSLCVYYHVLAALIIPLHALWFLILWPNDRQRWRNYIISGLCFILPYVPLIAYQWEVLNSTTYTAGYPFTSYIEMGRQLIVLHSRGIMGMTASWMIPIYFLLLVGLVYGHIQWRYRLMLITWLFIPPFFLYLISLAVPLYVDRYLIWIAPAYIILISLGVQMVPFPKVYNTRVLAYLMLIPLAAVWFYGGWLQTTLPIKANLRAAVSYTLDHREQNELLILQIPHNHHSFRYYSAEDSEQRFVDSTRRLSPWLPGVFTNHHRNEEIAWREVSSYLDQTTIGYDGVWVIYSEAQIWDNRQLLNRWLQENGTLEQSEDYRIAEVRYYRLP